MSNEEYKFNPICQACGAGCFDWGDIESDPQGYIAEVRKQARSDALREAACVVKANIRARDGREVICDAILALIDQPQEDVCEWEQPRGFAYCWHKAGCNGKSFEWCDDDITHCPYCGRPIKVTHGDKV